MERADVSVVSGERCLGSLDNFFRLTKRDGEGCRSITSKADSSSMRPKNREKMMKNLEKAQNGEEKVST